jgi:hypothetical protein
MKFRFFTKVNQHKSFSFNPRYYDERKERLDAIVKKQKEVQAENGFSLSRKEQLKDEISKTWGRKNSRVAQKKKSNTRIVVIVLLIIILGYFVFKDNSKDTNRPIIEKIDF